jgi:hypothetical protein
VYKKTTKDWYKFAEKDFQKYSETASIKDEYLVQELEKAGVKVHMRNPRVPDHNLSVIDNKVCHTGMQSLLGMACSVSQSWMLQYINSQIGS